MNANVQRTLSFIAIILGFFIALLDATIVNVSLPEMARYYGGSVGQISWIMNGYNLAFAVFILTASRLADQFGRKKVFLIGVFVFTLASLLAGLAPTIGMLIAFRVIQGLAGAIIVPVTIPLATDLFPKEMHGAIMGIWGGIAGLAAASGPALGGVLTDKLNWQWIFFVNIPLGIISIALAFWLIKESYDSQAGKRIDYAGTIGITGAMFCVTYALIKAKDYGWNSHATLLLFAFGAVFFLFFLLVEWRGKEPMLPLSLLRNRAFNGAALTMFVVGIGLMNMTFLTSFFLIRILGMTELNSGLLLSVLALSSMVTSIAAGPLSSKYGSRWFGAAGVVLILASTYWLGSLGSDSSRMDVILRLIVGGFGLGLTMSPVIGSTIRNVPEEKIGISSGIINMAKALGSVLGVALIVTVLQSNLSDELHTARAHAVQAVQSDSALSPAVKQAVGQALKQAGQDSSDASGSLSGKEANRVAAAIAKQGKLAAAKLPKEQQPEYNASLERELKEVKRLFPRVTADFRESAARAFSRTFVFSCWLLLPGIPLALISDRRRAGLSSVKATFSREKV